jgi:hypothetical protein
MLSRISSSAEAYHGHKAKRHTAPGYLREPETLIPTATMNREENSVGKVAINILTMNDRIENDFGFSDRDSRSPQKLTGKAPMRSRDSPQMTKD